MRRSAFILAVAAMLMAAMALPAVARGNGNPNPQPQVYVTSQGLVYDSIVTAESLPYNGQDNWQLLEMGGPTGLQTEFGPGDPGHFGGRWYLEMDGVEGPSEGDHFFLCPLLGPGQAP